MKYIFKLLRDGGLAATMLGLAISGAITNEVFKITAMACGVGAGVCAATRVPLAVGELNGFKGRFTA